jgi:hypothetical protein
MISTNLHEPLARLNRSSNIRFRIGCCNRSQELLHPCDHLSATFCTFRQSCHLLSNALLWRRVEGALQSRASVLLLLLLWFLTMQCVHADIIIVQCLCHVKRGAHLNQTVESINRLNRGEPDGMGAWGRRRRKNHTFTAPRTLLPSLGCSTCECHCLFGTSNSHWHEKLQGNFPRFYCGGILSCAQPLLFEGIGQDFALNCTNLTGKTC